MNGKKREKKSRKAYLRLIAYLLQNIKTLESYERIFYFIQDIAVGELKDGGRGG